MAAFAAVMLGLATVVTMRYLRVTRPGAVQQALLPYQIVNAYCLTPSIAIVRPELVVEGSDDGRSWVGYGFTYKPGDPQRAPPWLGLHMPRLDWKMNHAAHAALAGELAAPWFERFLTRLLEGSPSVRGLLAGGAFRDRPPRYLRLRLFLYRFAPREELRHGGMWWVREVRGFYGTAVKLQDGRLVPAAF